MKRVIIKVSVVFLSVALFIGCDEGNQIHRSGLEYKILTENKDSAQAKPGDFLVLDMKYTTESDSLLFNTREFDRPFKSLYADKPSHDNGCMEDAYSLMHVGDSIEFSIDARNFYLGFRRMPVPEYIKEGEKLKFYVKLLDAQTFKKIETERRMLHYSSSEEEMRVLDLYLQRTNVEVEPTEDGLFVIETEKGTGTKAVNGSRLKVHYSGTFVDGRVFDSSYKRNEPFEFTLGVGEMIEGWDIGLLGLNEGSKVKLIVPSNIAYSKEGYGEIIPPYATLVFEIEILKIY